MFFFFNDTATTEIYTLSLHDALPICPPEGARHRPGLRTAGALGRGGSALGRARRDREAGGCPVHGDLDRKSTRLNSSHANISYAVFCLKKKKNFCLLLLTLYTPSLSL